MINNRQNGRRRGRGGQRSQGGSSQGSRDNGNRIDSRARGNASQLLEKYKNLAADAQRQGDRVNTEYYLQFADHYFRVLADQRGRYEDQGQQQRRSQNDFDADEDYGDEGEPIRADEQNRTSDDRGNRDTRRLDGNRARSDTRPDQGDRYNNRDDGQRVESDGQRNERGDSHQRDGQDQRRRYSAPRADERTVEQDKGGETVTAESAPVTPSDTQADAPDVTAAPKRRGRPRKVPEQGEQLGLDVAALPPSIGAEAPAGEAAPKPRRRRSAAPVPAEADA